MIINNVRWSVRLVSPAHPLLLTPWRTHAYGVCDKVTQTICVDKTLSPQKLKEVLCHEITHAAMFSYNIELDYETEEILADIISKYGHEIIIITDKIFRDIQRGYL